MPQPGNARLDRTLRMSPVPFNEAQRLEALDALDILNSPPEQAFDIEETLLLAEQLGSNELTRFKTRLEMVIEPELPDLSADRSQVAQMLVNLISNAARFGPDDTLITAAA